MDDKPQGDQPAAQVPATTAGPGTKADDMGICTVPGHAPYPATKAQCDHDGGTWTRKG